jgi:hypothetical protein
MRLLVIALVLAAFAGAFAPDGDAAVSVRTPVDDVDFPFWCNWPYSASMNTAEPSLRPRLVIAYSSPTGRAR